MTKKNMVALRIFRKEGDTFLEFETDSKFEDFFKKKEHEVKESSSWTGLKFYHIPQLTTSKDYKDIVYRHNLIDDFGTSLVANGRFNIAFLRAVGGRGVIKVGDSLSFASVAEGVKSIVRFAKDYYESFIEDYSVNGKVSFEI